MAESFGVQKSTSDIKKSVKILDYPLPNHIAPGGITRERSFVRPSNPQNQMVINFTQIIYTFIYIVYK